MIRPPGGTMKRTASMHGRIGLRRRGCVRRRATGMRATGAGHFRPSLAAALHDWDGPGFTGHSGPLDRILIFIVVGTV